MTYWAAVCRRALALLACTCHGGPDSTPTGSLLIPNDEKDYANMLSSLMETQHSVLQKVHGVDSPQVQLSSSLLSLQSTVRRHLHRGAFALCSAVQHSEKARHGPCCSCAAGVACPKVVHTGSLPVSSPLICCMCALQIGTFVSNLTTEYSNFVKFLTTAPSWFVALANDVSLINRQINAVCCYHLLCMQQHTHRLTTRESGTSPV